MIVMYWAKDVSKVVVRDNQKSASNRESGFFYKSSSWNRLRRAFSDLIPSSRIGRRVSHRVALRYNTAIVANEPHSHHNFASTGSSSISSLSCLMLLFAEKPILAAVVMKRESRGDKSVRAWVEKC